MSTNRRSAVALLALLAVCVGLWWLLRETPPSSEELVLAAAPLRVATGRVAVAVPVAEEAAPLPEPPDSGAAPVASEALRDSIIYLAEGNERFVIPVGTDPFQRTCRREAEACATNELFWGGPPVLALFRLSREGEVMKVKDLSPMSLRSNHHLRFLRCLERSMKLATLESDVEAHEKVRSCDVQSYLKEPMNDSDGLAAEVGRCLGPTTPVKSVALEWDLVMVGNHVEVQQLEVTPEGELDGYARRCIERAASPAPLRFTTETSPRFDRWHRKLTVVTRSLGAPSSPSRR